jgi:hypothetical protein
MPDSVPRIEQIVYVPGHHVAPVVSTDLTLLIDIDMLPQPVVVKMEVPVEFFTLKLLVVNCILYVLPLG